MKHWFNKAMLSNYKFKLLVFWKINLNKRLIHTLPSLVFSIKKTFLTICCFKFSAIQLHFLNFYLDYLLSICLIISSRNNNNYCNHRLVY